MYGDGGNDILIGGSPVPGDGLSGYNYLNGTNDTLLGVGEKDTLIGGGTGSSNTFYLGDANGCYYLGGDDLDYANIENFDPNVDTIHLHGVSTDYLIIDGGLEALLYHIDAAGHQDLIAKIDGEASLLDLSDQFAFNYV
jgi:hypothetical protein